MGLGSFLKTIISPRAMAEEIIRLQEVAYREAAKLYPGADPHVLLVHAYLSRMAARGVADAGSPHSRHQAFVQTWQFALIPWPSNVRALGLYILNEERPDITRTLPEYAAEFNALLAPGAEATKNGLFFSKYEELNPQIAYAPSKENESGWLFGPKKLTFQSQASRYEFAAEPTECPVCASNKLAKYQYGHHAQIDVAAIERGEIILGGGIIRDSSPAWKCGSSRISVGFFPRL